MRRISAWTSWRLAGEQLLELGVAHHLGVVLERVGDLLLLRLGGITVLLSAMLVNENDSDGEHDRRRRTPARTRARTTRRRS